MSKQTEEEIFHKGDKIFCIDQSNYEIHLIKRKEYEVFDVGVGTKFGKIRIKGWRNRLVWIWDLYFSKNNQPEIVNIVIDDEEFNPQNDYIEVTVSFSDGSKSWLNFITLNCIETKLNSFDSYFYNKNTIIVEELTYEKIKETITELDKTNDLIKILIPYEKE